MLCRSVTPKSRFVAETQIERQFGGQLVIVLEIPAVKGRLRSRRRPQIHVTGAGGAGSPSRKLAMPLPRALPLVNGLGWVKPLIEEVLSGGCVGGDGVVLFHLALHAKPSCYGCPSSRSRPKFQSKYWCARTTGLRGPNVIHVRVLGNSELMLLHSG